MNTDATIYEFILFLLFCAGILVMLIGACIIVSPAWVIRTSKTLNTWVSTESFFNRLEQQRHSESFFYRHHILFGCLLIVGAGYIFYTFMFSVELANYSLPVFASQSANEWFTSSLVFMNILFSALIFIIGMIIVIRPSLLKHFEEISNHWFVVDDSLKRLDLQLRTPDTIFIRYPRLVGFLIVIGSCYILFNLFPIL